MSITLTAFGWSDPDLVRLAQSVIADDGDVSLADPSLIDGYQLISPCSLGWRCRAHPAEQIFYASNTNPDGGIGVSVALRPPTNAGGATLDRQIALRFLLDHATPFDVDGHLAVAGVTTDQDDFSLASWIAGDHIVTVSAAMPVPELIAIARTVHEVSFEDWNGMQFQAARYNSDNNFGKYQETKPLSGVVRHGCGRSDVVDRGLDRDVPEDIASSRGSGTATSSEARSTTRPRSTRWSTTVAPM